MLALDLTLGKKGKFTDPSRGLTEADLTLGAGILILESGGVLPGPYQRTVSILSVTRPGQPAHPPGSLLKSPYGPVSSLLET